VDEGCADRHFIRGSYGRLRAGMRGGFAFAAHLADRTPDRGDKAQADMDEFPTKHHLRRRISLVIVINIR